MHTLFCYYCFFCPIRILLHTLNSTLYFVLFRTFNSVNHCSYSCSLPSRKLSYEFFQLVTQRTAWLGTWMGNELLSSTSFPGIALLVNHQPYRVVQKAIDVLVADWR